MICTLKVTGDSHEDCHFESQRKMAYKVQDQIQILRIFFSLRQQ